ncbi:MAG: cytochrome c [Bradyrhizobiaceae bacterium]|nr:cytochrome c [Bradyrhizobiaceae bacterium]
MSMRKSAIAGIAASVMIVAGSAGIVLAGGPEEAQSLDQNLRPNLGKPITPADLAPWDITILPDGTNLPPGSGRAADGEKIYAEKCSACHGDKGQGGIAGRVIGGPPKATLDGGKTIANFWPAATTLFDFIRRAMPYSAPRSLTDQEVYALTAYLLAANKLIGDNDEINARTLPQVKMPNRDNFIIRFPDRI